MLARFPRFARFARRRDGKDESGQSDMMAGGIDPVVFFAVMFGSELVEGYVGELWIASVADSLFKEMQSAEDMEKKLEVSLIQWCRSD